jgi:hypothetical protein
VGILRRFFHETVSLIVETDFAPDDLVKLMGAANSTNPRSEKLSDEDYEALRYGMIHLKYYY